MVWRRFGEGPPLVLLHGGHGNWLHWARNIDALAARFELWLPDLPAYGESATPPEPTLEVLLAATQDSLDALVGKGTPIALAGFSFGGLVATQLALRRGRITRMALLGPGGHGGARRPRGELRSWRDAYAQKDVDGLREVMRHNLLMHMLAGQDVDALALEIHTRACLQTRFRSKPISRAGGLNDALIRFEEPLLLIWGEHDITATPTELAHALVTACRNARAEIVPGAGHWVQYQAAAHVDSLLLGWFAQDAAGASHRMPASPI
jgi:pimeloyl-ACP methyl ester carboxylesterase